MIKAQIGAVPAATGTDDRSRLREMFAPSKSYADSKIMQLGDAIRKHFKAGLTVHFGYAGATPMAASNALVRVFAGTRPDFSEL